MDKNSKIQALDLVIFTPFMLSGQNTCFPFSSHKKLEVKSKWRTATNKST